MNATKEAKYLREQRIAEVNLAKAAAGEGDARAIAALAELDAHAQSMLATKLGEACDVFRARIVELEAHAAKHCETCCDQSCDRDELAEAFEANEGPMGVQPENPETVETAEEKALDAGEVRR